MKALSIRQPWAWLIVNGWKNIENREWPTRFRGRFLVHASKAMTWAEYDACRLFMAGFTTTLDLPPMGALERGGIVGAAVLLDCVQHHTSEWFCGPYGFVLDEARALPFQPLRGALGFFDVPNTTSEARFFCSNCQKFWTQEELVECVPCDPRDGCPVCEGCCHELWPANAQHDAGRPKGAIA